MPIRYFAFDTETTGLNAFGGDEIISLAYMLLNEDLEEVAAGEILALPSDGVEVHPAAAAINGYTRERWLERGAVTQRMLFNTLVNIWSNYGLDRVYPLGQNIAFDLDFLKAYGQKHKAFASYMNDALSYHKLDTLVLAVSLDLAHGTRGVLQRLTAQAERWGVPLENAHDAMCDLQATVEIYKRQLALLKTSAPPPVALPNRLLEKRGEELVLAFGKHKGVPLATVDEGYLRWSLKNMTLRDEERALLEARLA